MAKRDSGTSSLLAVILGLGVLGVFAFVAGGLVGVLWKEPGLLFAYVRGDTTEITWNTAAQEIEAALPPVGLPGAESLPPVGLPGAESLPPVGLPGAESLSPVGVPAARPQGESTPAESPAATPEKPKTKQAPTVEVAKRKTSPPPAAAPPPRASAPADASPRIAIQVGAFAERGGAEQLRESLLADGYPAYLAAGSTTGNARWRVRVGPYPARAEADLVATRLKRSRELPTWVLDEDTE